MCFIYKLFYNTIFLVPVPIVKYGKFILYANIPYLYPPTPNPLGGPWGIEGFGGEAYVSDIWPLKNLGEFP